MIHKRWILFALAALLVIVVLGGLGGGGQREAWMQGYMMGRLSTESDSGAALAPYMMPGGPSGFHNPGFGFGHGVGLFIGLGFLAFGLVFLAKRLSGFGPHGEFREWRDHIRREMDRWHEQEATRKSESGQSESTRDERTQQVRA